MIKIKVKYWNVDVEADYEGDIDNYPEWRKKFKRELDYTLRDINEIGAFQFPEQLTPQVEAPQVQEVQQQAKPMTNKQKALLRSRGIDFDENMNIDQASALIKTVLGN